MKGNHSESKRAALAVLEEDQISTAGPISKLQAVAIEQFSKIPVIEREAALRAIFAGLTLHRIKASIPGKFSKWISEMLPRVTSWTPATARKNSSFYMRLATVAIAETGATTELLALSGDQAELSLEPTDAGARRFVDKLTKFVGDKSLNELLREHGIKDAKALGGKREKAEADAAPIDPEQLAAQSREELSAWHEQGRQLLITDNVCSHLSADEIRAFDESLDAMLSQWRRGLKHTLKKSA
jgi:hypothetical protein